MNKWLWLLLLIVVWIGMGVLGSGALQDRGRRGAALPSQVERIVSMAPNLTEILFALGLDDEIVGVTTWSEYPPEAKNKPNVGTFWQPNIEAVIAAKPDLVVTLGFEQQKSLAGRLERIGYNCVSVNIERVDDLFEAIETVAAAASRQGEGAKLVRDMKEKLNTLSRLVAAGDRPKVLWVVQREPLRVAGRDTFVNEMIELAGGENAIGPTIHKYPPIGGEQVIAGGADIIIEPAMGREDTGQEQEDALQFWNKFRNVPAVMNKQIHVIRGDTVSRLGPRLYEGIEAIAKCLHPEHFAD